MANRRHFPSINWLSSYSLYTGDLGPWYAEHVAKDWAALRNEAIELLQKEAELQEIVQLVGSDALPEREKAVLDTARMIREDYLQQSAYDEVDTYTSIGKQFRMLRAILDFGRRETEAVGKGVALSKAVELPVRVKIARMKTQSEKEGLGAFDLLDREMTDGFRVLEEEVVA